MKINLQSNAEQIETAEYLLSYIKMYMINMIDKYKNDDRFKQLDKVFGFNSYQICRFAILSSYISRVDDNFIISIDNRLKINGILISPLIKIITYGNLEVKGFPILDEIFTYVNKHIESICKEIL